MKELINIRILSVKCIVVHAEEIERINPMYEYYQWKNSGLVGYTVNDFKLLLCEPRKGVLCTVLQKDNSSFFVLVSTLHWNYCAKTLCYSYCFNKKLFIF